MIPDLIRDTFALKENEGNKVMPLSQAVKQFVQPRHSIYFTSDSSASVLELCRQFWGTKPDFTLICLIISGYRILPIYGKLIKRVVTSSMFHGYPTSGPISVVQQAEKEWLEVELTSMFVLQLRYMASVLGVPFMPTKSMVGTDIAKEAKDIFIEMENPFGQGKTGIVKALTPDVAFIHGLVADPYGNTILSLPHSELWGTRAGKRIIVTVEKLVTTDFIRRHSSLVHVPGYLVDAVCLAPLGAHPSSFTALTLEGEVDSYDNDYPFQLEYRNTVEDPQAIDPWIEKWILNTRSQEDYLRLLGRERITRLKEQAKQTWEEKIDLSRIPTSAEYHPGEIGIIAAARKIKETVVQKGYKALLFGPGPGLAAASLAYYLLRRQGHPLDLISPSGAIGYSPRPGRAQMGTVEQTRTATMLADSVIGWGMGVAGANSRCVSVLGTAEVDKEGNMNSTSVRGTRLFGGGGVNDGAGGQEIIVVGAEHQKRRLVDRVSFVTVPGDKIRTVCTNIAILEKRDGELVLTGYVPGKPKEERIKEIQEGCGWELKVAPEVAEFPPPTPEELLILRYIDPDGLYSRR